MASESGLQDRKVDRNRTASLTAVIATITALLGAVSGFAGALTPLGTALSNYLAGEGGQAELSIRELRPLYGFPIKEKENPAREVYHFEVDIVVTKKGNPPLANCSGEMLSVLFDSTFINLVHSFGQPRPRYEFPARRTVEKNLRLPFEISLESKDPMIRIVCDEAVTAWYPIVLPVHQGANEESQRRQ